MNRSGFCILAASLACLTLQAQPAVDPIAEMKASYTSIKNNLLRAAEKMPEEDYNFKPVDSIRTFGQLIAHIAGQARTCGMIASGEQKPVDTSKTSKADLVAALTASFDVCDTAWDAMKMETAHETIAGRGGQQRTKIGTLINSTIVHNNEEYGYLAVYMRLKNIVPPSSDRAGR